MLVESAETARAVSLFDGATRRDTLRPMSLGVFAGLLLNSAPIRRYGRIYHSRGRLLWRRINTDAGNRGRIRLLHWAVKGDAAGN